MFLCLALLACAAPPAPKTPSYPLHGTVLMISRDDHTLTVEHDDIDGFMPSMTMTLAVEGDLLQLAPGAEIDATLVVGERSFLKDIVIVKPAKQATAGGEAWTKQGRVPVGEVLPTTELMISTGPPVVLGVGQTGRIAVTFIYTRCPIPEFCPLVSSRMAALQEQLPPGGRIIAVTLDPDFDSKEVLNRYAKKQGARPGEWDFARLPQGNLVALAERLGLKISRDRMAVDHGLLLTIVDEKGRIVRRYEHMKWPLNDVVAALAGP